MTATIFEIKRFAVHDGDGIRTTVFFKGCPLRCLWCHNPEGLSMEGGTACDISQLLEEVKRSKAMFFDGGVTLTGGEVCMQLDSVKEFLVRLKQEGIHTCIETNGTSLRLPELFPLLDLLIMDIKHYDEAFHKTVTGASCSNTFRNIEAALECGLPLALRIPVIGGFNAAASDAEGFVNQLTALGVPGKATVELLAYHEYGKDKYAALGMEYTMTKEARVTPETIHYLSTRLQDAGIQIVRT